MRLPSFVALFLLTASTAFAQPGDSAIATVNTAIYVVPEASRTPLRTAAQGTRFNVVSEEGEWAKVQFQDPQWGTRTGYVAIKDIRILRAGLEPMDLSVRPSSDRSGITTDAAPPVVTRSGAQPSTTSARTRSGRSFERGWIDVNLGGAIAAEKRFSIEASRPLYRETLTGRSAYDNPTGASFDFGGGFMFTPQVGVGISFSGTAHQSPPEMFISVPHPLVFNAHATDTSESDREFQRIEGGVHLQLMAVAPISPRVRVRVFGGPTYFRVQQDLVDDIRYNQVFQVFGRGNAVEITEYDYAEKVEGTGWGFNVGGDVSIFFTRVIGLGGFARYSRGTVGVFDPLLDDTVDLKAGGFQTGGGVRLKF